MRKLLLLVAIVLTENAYAIDFAKTCEIASKYVAPMYSYNYDYYRKMFSNSRSNSKERKKQVEEIHEEMEQLLDKVASSIDSLGASDKFAVMSVYQFVVYRTDLIATKDAENDKNKQPIERVQRTIFSDCLAK